MNLTEQINFYQTKIESFFQKDKLEHFLIGTLVTLASLALMKLGLFNLIWVLIVPIFCAIAKELIDKFIRKRTFDLSDIAWTIAPAVLIFLIETI